MHTLILVLGLIFFKFVFYCQWILFSQNVGNENKNLNTDDYLATCSETRQALSVQPESSQYLKAIPQTNKRNVLQVLGSVLLL